MKINRILIVFIILLCANFINVQAEEFKEFSISSIISNYNKHYEYNISANDDNIKNVKNILLKYRIIDNNGNSDIFNLKNLSGNNLINKINSIISSSNKKGHFNIIYSYITKLKDANDLINKSVYLEPSRGKESFKKIADDIQTRMETLLFVYVITGNDMYAKRAYNEMEAICNWSDWQDKRSGTTNFLGTSELAYSLSIGYDWLHNYLNSNQKQKIEKTLINYALLPYFWDKNLDTFDNISYNQNLVCNSLISIASLLILNTNYNIEVKNITNNSLEFVSTTGKYEVTLKNKEMLNIIKNEVHITAKNNKKYVTSRELAATIIKKAINQIYKHLGDKTYYSDGSFKEGPTYWSYTMQYVNYFFSSISNLLGEKYVKLFFSRINNYDRIILYPIFITNNSNPTSNSIVSAFNYADSNTKYLNSARVLWMANYYAKYSGNDECTKALYNYKKNRNAFNLYDMLWYDEKYDIDSISYETIMNKYIYGNSKINKSNIGVVTLRTNYDYGKSNSIFVGIRTGSNHDTHGDLDLGSFIFDSLGTRWIDDNGASEYAKNYFNYDYWRWQYYKKRAESHSTILINPQEKGTSSSGNIKYVMADQWIYGSGKVNRVVNNNSLSYVTINLDTVYNKNDNNNQKSTVNNNKVSRGIMLFDNKKYMYLQDEIKLEKKGKIYSMLNINSDVKIELKNEYEALLTDSKNNKLTIKLVTNNSKFKIISKKPLNSFLTTNNSFFDYKENTIDSKNNKLVVCAKDTLNITIGLLFIPHYNGTSKPINVKPISLVNWDSVSIIDSNTIGDVDNDGKVSSKDYVLIKKHIMSISTLTGNSKQKADINGDNKITSIDYILIKKQILGK